MTQTNAPLWTPSQERIDRSPMQAFARYCAPRAGRDDTAFDNYDTFHAWSVAESTAFWDALWDYCDVIGEKGARLIENPTAMPGAQFFPDAQISYAQNMLRRTGPDQAIVFRSENGAQRHLSWDALRALVSRLQQAFRAAGVKAGDRIAAMVPNVPETIACMLAANSLGAIWSSCSPDFGVQGVLDRFTQIEPTLFVACDGYWYAGKEIDIGEKLTEIIPALGARQTVLIPYRGVADDMVRAIDGDVVSLTQFIAPFEAGEPVFERLPFNHPLYILFSSGTTGVPKCIVHGQGGVLLQHLKEHRFHCGITPEDRVFYFTTCGWMMWNWLVSSMAAQATVMLYDGSPFHPDGNVVFDYVAQEKITFFGTSAKFIDAVRTSGLRPME
ncbi:MAG: AMP-binding protein, partial [Pseudomonadota bacterium]